MRGACLQWQSYVDFSFRKGRYVEALNLARAALEAYPPSPEKEELARNLPAMASLADRQRETEELEKQGSSAGGDVDKLMEIARMNVKVGEMAKAVKSASEAVRLAPENPQVQAEYVATLFAAKDFVAVEQAAKDATATALKKGDRPALIRIMDAFSQAVDEDISSYGIYECPDRIKELDPFDFSESCRSAYPDEPWLTLASARISQALEMHGRKIKDNFRFLMEYGFPAIEKAYARRDWELTYLLAEKCQGRIQMNSYIFYPLPSDQVELVRNARPIERFEMAAQAVIELEKLKLQAPGATPEEKTSKEGRRLYAICLGEMQSHLIISRFAGLPAAKTVLAKFEKRARENGFYISTLSMLKFSLCDWLYLSADPDNMAEAVASWKDQGTGFIRQHEIELARRMYGDPERREMALKVLEKYHTTIQAPDVAGVQAPGMSLDELCERSRPVAGYQGCLGQGAGRCEQAKQPGGGLAVGD